MFNPLVSVIVPTFNQAWYLPYALDSMVRQSFTDFELLVIDDGSTDDTPAVLRRWCQRNGHRAKPYKLPENRGTAAAINAGVELATGKYLTWISSDNLMRVDFLERLVAELDAGAGCAYGGFTYHRVESREQAIGIAVSNAAWPPMSHFEPYHPARQIAQEECYLGPAHLVRRECWAEHRGRISHDLGAFLRIEESCWAHGFPIVGVPEPLCLYFSHDERATVTRRHEYDAPQILAEAKARRATPAARREIVVVPEVKL